MEVYNSLIVAVQQLGPEDTRRIYAVRDKGIDDLRYVIAPSPASAAFAVIGEENVTLVSQRDRYKATQEALQAVLERHNAKVDAAK